MIELSDVEAARDRIDDLIVQTPISHSRAFSRKTGASIDLKLEMFQRTGAFKLRGAANRIRTLSESERGAGVVTASAGNHAQGVALAAAESGVDATVVMPRDAPISKVASTREYGAEVILEGQDYDAAQKRAHDLAETHGWTYVHAFDDPAVMAGQGTIGLEIVEERPDVDTIVVSIGGGGLISGIAAAVAELAPDVRIIGVQAERAASVPQSLEQGRIFERDAVDTIADGIATRRVGDGPFAVIREHVDEVVTVTDDELAIAVTRLLERSKTLVEPAGAAPLAAVFGQAFSYQQNESIVPVLSGGNVDLNVLTTLVVRGLIESGRYTKLKTILKDQPGALLQLSQLIADQRANITAIEHDRTRRDVAMNAAEVELELETRGKAHLEQVISALEDAGYEIEVVA